MANASRTVCIPQVLLARHTGIADESATSIIRVFVPNDTVAGSVEIRAFGVNGSTNAFEGAYGALGHVVFCRTSGVAVVPTAATLTLTAQATTSGGDSMTLTYGVSSVVGDNDKAQYFDIQVTLNDESGDTGSNQVIYEASLISSEPGIPGGPYMVSL